MQEDERLLTVREAAAWIRVSEDTIRRWLKIGELRGKRLSGNNAGWRVSVGEIRAFLASDHATPA